MGEMNVHLAQVIIPCIQVYSIRTIDSTQARDMREC
jgi:hypothetical protein